MVGCHCVMRGGSRMDAAGADVPEAESSVRGNSRMQPDEVVGKYLLLLVLVIENITSMGIGHEHLKGLVKAFQFF